MFGVYFHIPFCKSKCGYCDFYSEPSQTLVQPVVEAMLQEVELRQKYFTSVKNAGSSATLYFGGGTPSLLHPSQIAALAQKAIHTFAIKSVDEFTVEVNPDDATPEYLQGLRAAGADRLSIGVQSFFDDDLRRANRRHTAQQARQSVEAAQAAGFANVSVDLIYGLPHMSISRWRANVKAALALGITHLSAYALTVAERTPFGEQQRRRRLALPTEDGVAAQSRLLDELCARRGFTRYEISSCCREGFFSRHNTAYWQQQPYIGIGPAAHSYSGEQRHCNVASNALYSARVGTGRAFFEVETLTREQRYNEYIFTGLRTMWGVSLRHLRRAFGRRLYEHCLHAAQRHLNGHRLTAAGDVLTIPQRCWLIADSIIVDLIWAE